MLRVPCPVPPCHGACFGLRRPSPHAPRQGYACASRRAASLCRRRSRRPGVNRARARFNITGPCMSVPRSQVTCSQRGTARARCASLTLAVHARSVMSCAPVRRPRTPCSRTVCAQRQVSAVTASPSPRSERQRGACGVALRATPRPQLEQLVKLAKLVNTEDLEHLEDLVDRASVRLGDQLRRPASSRLFPHLPACSLVFPGNPWARPLP